MFLSLVISNCAAEKHSMKQFLPSNSCFSGVVCLQPCLLRFYVVGFRTGEIRPRLEVSRQGSSSRSRRRSRRSLHSLMNEIMAALVTFCSLGPDLFHPIFFYPMVLTSVLGASIRLVGLLLRFLFLLLTEKNCCLVIMLTRKVFQAYI